ncbi:hypothetical protein M2352_002904 [Azospirillum fermentarium]|uniref:hypothetical protein n=1 Tax=Azospirillum fermentarium TaxID=1233114 RepID=UPI0022268DF2|nr:hypothetical protein [Azospirillum fermentarium]MCW2247313.1 hypothetical protein [Azospirillum fermentarium]
MTDLRRQLLRQMEAIRQRLDPKVLDRARWAAFGKVPYDRDEARQAVSLFLDSRDDGGVFRAKLEDALRKEGETLDLPAPSPPSADSGGPSGPHPLKPRRTGRIT